MTLSPIVRGGRAVLLGLASILAILTFSSAAQAAPANDAFSNATVLPASLPASMSGDNLGAGKEAGEPNHAGNAGGHSVWYSWTPAANEPIGIQSACFGSVDLLIGVYTGASVGSLTPVADNGVSLSTDCFFSELPQAEFKATTGTTYWIAVDGREGDQGSFQLRFNHTPANDDFADAASIAAEPPQEVAGTTRIATKELGEPDHAGDPGGHSVWYSWTPTSSGMVEITTCSASALDALLAVYTGSALGALAEVASNDEAPGPERLLCRWADSAVSFDAVAGITYKIAVDGSDGSVGRFALKIRGRPQNDDFAGAQTLSNALPSFFAEGSNGFATKQAGEPDHAGDPGGHSLWYSWTPTTSGKVRISTCTTSGTLDALLAVYTGSSLGSLSAFASNDDASNQSCRESDAAVRLTVSAGTTYWIAVDGKNGSVGNFSLSGEGLPANDDFSAATPAPVEPGSSVLGNTAAATKQAGEPDHAGDPGGHSVWYSWTPSASGPVAFSTCPYGETNPDTLLAVYTGAAVNALTPVVSNDDSAAACREIGSEVEFDAVSGTTYWIAVDSKSSSGGLFSLELNGRPQNDEFVAAQVLPTEPIAPGGTTILATKQAGEPDHAGNPGGHSVWYSWTAPNSGKVDISACGASGDTDTLLAVYTGAAVNALTPVASNDDAAGASPDERCESSTGSSEVEFDAVSGAAYKIAVDTKNGVGRFALDIERPPANDTFAKAALLSRFLPSYGSGDMKLATKEAGEPNHAGDPGGHSLWFVWTAPVNGPVSISTCTHSGSLDALLGVYYGGSQVSNLHELVSNDDGAIRQGCRNTDSEVHFDAVAEVGYAIVVDGKQGTTGQFQLLVEGAAPNDDFGHAQPLGGGLPAGWLFGSNRFATKQVGEPDHGGNAGGHSVWFKWTAPSSGTVSADTCGSRFDTLLAVYTGVKLNGLTPVQSNDDGSGKCAPGSRVSFPAAANTTYRIAVDGKSGAEGLLELHVDGRPGNDDFGSATKIPGSLGWYLPGSTSLATTQVGEPGGVGGHSVWYSWTPQKNGTVRLDACAAGFDPLLGIYTGNAMGSLTPVATTVGSGECSEGASVSFAVVSGTTYHLAVAGGSGEEGHFELHLRGADTLTHLLSVVKAGSGSGTVSSGPAGIDCGVICNHEFAPTAAVTLTATPSPSSTFAGWSGGGCAGTGTCQVSLGSDVTVTATFVAAPTGATTPAPTSSVPPPLATAKKPLKCKPGFKKIWIHGKEKCVSKRGKRHRPVRKRG